MAFPRVQGLGCVSFKKLAEHFDDPTEAFSASAADLAQIQGLDQNVIDGLRHFSRWNEVKEEIGRAQRAAVKIVPFASPEYPARLRMISSFM
jgi:DNA processing protein